MDLVDIIARRRDGLPHSPEEFRVLTEIAAKGDEKYEYQLAAWLMAAYLNPLDRAQTIELTQAMAGSGERVDLTGLPQPWVDKHSTGGVGDKTSIAILPILAACGLTIVKMSGAGLGITGGTVDKLESIPGFRMDLSPEELKAQASKIGLAITGQTPNLAPADKTLYRLRDTTATVASMPLIVSSILSKKLAGGAEKLVLDVKCGSGAFMKSFEEAHTLAMELVEVAKACGLPTIATITDMDQPLGSAVGNAVEVCEAFGVLTGESRGRFYELVHAFAVETLVFSGVYSSELEAGSRVDLVLERGNALKKADEWIAAQSNQVASVGEALKALPVAPVRVEYKASHSGFISRINAEAVGHLVIELGGGRKVKNDKIEHSVGLEFFVEVGSEIVAGQPIAKIHAKSESDAVMAKKKLDVAIQLVEESVSKRKLIQATVD